MFFDLHVILIYDFVVSNKKYEDVIIIIVLLFFKLNILTNNLFLCVSFELFYYFI
jgi:hypothetical protein